MSQARGCSLLFKTTVNHQRRMEERFLRKDDQGEGVTLHGAPDQKAVALETRLGPSGYESVEGRQDQSLVGEPRSHVPWNS